MTNKIPVAILGATGTVGQQFINLLQNHAWFEITHLLGSSQSAGKKYGEIMHNRWKLETPLPQKYADFIVADAQEIPDVRLAFSALDSSVATKIESKYAKKGIGVFSNSKNFRMHPQVPIIIPEINPQHLDIIQNQLFDPQGKGFIVTNPNCSLQAAALSLYPIFSKFGLKKIMITTMQAISGAGYPGVASLDILGNVVPFIDGEEEKIQIEISKIFGNLNNLNFNFAPIQISAMCNRVAVVNGHLCNISFETKEKVEQKDILDLWQVWRPEVASLSLPSYQNPLFYFENSSRPQPRLDNNLGQGMTVSMGNLRHCEVLDFKFQALVNNTVRGAAGGAILSAELWFKNYKNSICKN